MENKEKIAKLRAQIAKLQEMRKTVSAKNPMGYATQAEAYKSIDAKIATLNAEIQKIEDVGNGDGTGRKPIGASPVRG